MIEARELRVGNYIYPYFSDGSTGEIINSRIGIPHVVQVHSIDESGINCFGISHYETGIFYESALPIPISEEWLLKMGFKLIYKSERSINYSLAANGKFGYENINDGILKVRYLGEYFDHIKFIHQLQNLYFALTQKELLADL